MVEYKDIQVNVNFKPFIIKAILCDDGYARVSFDSLPYSKHLPRLITTPFIKIINDIAFQRYMNDLSEK